MPARYTSARFVGRDEAFARLASALDDAAQGRARSMLIGGSAGVGVTRLLDEAIDRMAALTEPLTLLRASAWPGGDDEPYGPLIRAIGPTLAGAAAGRPGRAVSGPPRRRCIRLLPELGVRLDAADVEPPREPM